MRTFAQIKEDAEKAKKDAEDVIVYTVVRNGGGVDGMDRNDKGGQIRNAFFDKAEAEKCKDGYTTVKTEIVNLKQRRVEAFKKLDGLDRLVLGLEKE